MPEHNVIQLFDSLPLFILLSHLSKFRKLKDFAVVQALKHFNTIMEKLIDLSDTGIEVAVYLSKKAKDLMAKKRRIMGEQQTGTRRWHF